MKGRGAIRVSSVRSRRVLAPRSVRQWRTARCGDMLSKRSVRPPSSMATKAKTMCASVEEPLFDAAGRLAFMCVRMRPFGLCSEAGGIHLATGANGDTNARIFCEFFRRRTVTSISAAACCWGRKNYGASAGPHLYDSFYDEKRDPFLAENLVGLVSKRTSVPVRGRLRVRSRPRSFQNRIYPRD